MTPPFDHPEIFLHPGEFYFGPSPGRIGTLLGSCVAVTIWHPHYRFGGMCHILLPFRKRSPGTSPDCRYAEDAIERFAAELNAKGVAPQSCQVKLFGGGNMFSGSSAGRIDIGRRNIEATRKALASRSFSVTAEHVGGTSRRRLFLDLSTGHVWMAAPGKLKAQQKKENQ